MMGDAIDIADFMVQECLKKDRPTTNMKLQKMLYFAWIEYYKKNKEWLFTDNFLAWKLGPVVYEVYAQYRVFGAMPITYVRDRKGRKNLPDDVISFLEQYVNRNKDVSGSQLVRESHRAGGAWAHVHDDSKSNVEIPFEDIMRLECQ